MNRGSRSGWRRLISFARVGVVSGVFALSVSNCSGGFYECDGDRACGNRSAATCLDGCEVTVRCAFELCEGHDEASCAAIPHCGFDDLGCRATGPGPACDAPTEEQCVQLPHCAWRPACTGTATPCAAYSDRVACNKQEGCEWMHHPGTF